MPRLDQWLHPGPLQALPQRSGQRAGQTSDFLPHDPPFGELALISPDGQHPPTLDWQHEQPVALLHNVRRLTCGNPSVMTGPGTNSYVVGEPATGFIVIDPGPNEPAHLQRLWQACQGDIRMIVCTHSHSDHSPGAQPLQALCAAQGRQPPILGLSSLPTARPNSHFVPQRDDDLVLARDRHPARAAEADKIVVGVAAANGATSVNASSYMFDQQVAMFLASLPPAAVGAGA